MENQVPNQTIPTPTVNPVPQPVQTPQNSGNKIVDLLNNLPKKIMENKKVLIIVGVVFVIFIILILLASVITKNIKNAIIKRPVVNSPTPTPAEQITDPTKVSTVAGELSTFKDQLVNLKNQIDNLDVDQSRISPPSINFKINFEVKK